MHTYTHMALVYHVVNIIMYHKSLNTYTRYTVIKSFLTFPHELSTFNPLFPLFRNSYHQHLSKHTKTFWWKNANRAKPIRFNLPIDGQHQHGVGTAACLSLTGTCRLLGCGSAKENFATKKMRRNTKKR